MYKNKVVQVRLKDIVADEDVLNDIESTCRRVNLLTTHLYQFLRLWIVSLKEFPEITTDVIRMALKVLTPPSNGPKPKGENGKCYKELLYFYKVVYSKLGYEEKISGVNLSSISDYIVTKVETAISNNIKSHYLNHIKRYINSIYKPLINMRLDREKNTLAKKDLKKKLYSELNSVKSDVLSLEENLKSPRKYHNNIYRLRQTCLPADYSIEDLYANPMKYLKYLLNISSKMELAGVKQFQFFSY